MTAQPRPTDGHEDLRQSVRYAIRTPVTCRSENDSKWHRGTTENISCNGILFHADVAIQLETPIEVNFVLPSSKAQTGAEVHCRGKVVRCEPSKAITGATMLAVRVGNCRMMRGDAPSQQAGGGDEHEGIEGLPGWGFD
jgi:hypothetical protein